MKCLLQGSGSHRFVSQIQEELFLFQLAFSEIVRQGKSQNTVPIETCIFQNTCFFGKKQSKRQKKTLKLAVLSGQWWEAASVYPFWSLPRCASLTVSVVSHQQRPPDTAWGPAPNRHEQRVSQHCWGSLQPFLAEISCPGCAGLPLWEFVPMSENTETIIKNLVPFLLFTMILQAQKEKKYPSPLRDLFSLHFSDLEVVPHSTRVCTTELEIQIMPQNLYLQLTAGK